MRFFFLAAALVSVLIFIGAPVGASYAHDEERAADAAYSRDDAGQTAHYELEITFSKKLRKRLATIDRVEQIREERFRRSLIDESNPYMTILNSSAAPSSNDTVDWAGAQLISDLQDYGVENLIRSLVSRTMSQVAPDFKGLIRLRLDRIKVDNHSVAFLRASRSYVTGKIEVRDDEGRKIIEDKMTVDLDIEEIEALDYRDVDLAFAEADGSDRVGPVLAAFVQTVLGEAWPEQKERLPGVVMVRTATGPLISIRD